MVANGPHLRHAALWVGLLYDSVALDAAWDWSRTGRRKNARPCATASPSRAFKTPFRKATVHELTHRMLEISAAGLKRRAALDSGGMNEDGFLSPLREMVNRGPYPRRGNAEELLRCLGKRPHAAVHRV